MFIYDTNEFVIMAKPRCGSTSLYNFFNIEYNSLDNRNYTEWSNSSLRKILVLRNPYDRITSAYKLLQELPFDAATKSEMFITHSCPYMWKIENVDFEYIDFYKLNEYIPLSDDTITTNTSNLSSKVYISNDRYNKDLVEKEYNLYKMFLSTRKEITPEEWNEIIK